MFLLDCVSKSSICVAHVCVGYRGCWNHCYQYYTASPPNFCFVISHRWKPVVWSASCKDYFFLHAPASFTTFITDAHAWCRSSSLSRTFPSTVTDALYLDMHVPTRDDAAVSDPPYHIRCRWVTAAECASCEYYWRSVVQVGGKWPIPFSRRALEMTRSRAC